ncbi:18674_t:CDS:2 [Rhizophagus irregularis]|nr:18674_t:CDS:2 [Rhizophagus irregularis]
MVYKKYNSQKATPKERIRLACNNLVCNNIAQAFGVLSNAFQTILQVSLLLNLPNFNANLGQQLAPQLAK